jgi:hypothetical protein
VIAELAQLRREAPESLVAPVRAASEALIG